MTAAVANLTLLAYQATPGTAAPVPLHLFLALIVLVMFGLLRTTKPTQAERTPKATGCGAFRPRGGYHRAA